MNGRKIHAFASKALQFTNLLGQYLGDGADIFADACHLPFEPGRRDIVALWIDGYDGYALVLGKFYVWTRETEFPVFVLGLSVDFDRISCMELLEQVFSIEPYCFREESCSIR